MTEVALLFPGQGSQHVGMVLDLFESYPVAKEVFNEVNDILGIDLKKMCFEGPGEVLNETYNAQPAILTASYAAYKVIQENCGGTFQPQVLAGHSLGEYTALVVSGALKFQDAIKLVRERGRLMKEAGEKAQGGMLAVIGATSERVEKRACHTTLMGPAQEEFNLFLEKVSLERAKVPVYANTTAKAITSPEDIKTELRQQLCGPIKWRQSIQRMHNEGVGYYIELGPGKVLSGLGRRIIPGSHGINFGKCDELEKVCEIICG
jgi:[acyl-carrier-protein] S-malonyltransferase